jgi:hypothetical protein
VTHPSDDWGDDRDEELDEDEESLSPDDDDAEFSEDSPDAVAPEADASGFGSGCAKWGIAAAVFVGVLVLRLALNEVAKEQIRLNNARRPNHDVALGLTGLTTLEYRNDSGADCTLELFVASKGKAIPIEEALPAVPAGPRRLHAYPGPLELYSATVHAQGQTTKTTLDMLLNGTTHYEIRIQKDHTVTVQESAP